MIWDRPLPAREKQRLVDVLRGNAPVCRAPLALAVVAITFAFPQFAPAVEGPELSVPTEHRDSQDLLLLGPDRPFIIRLHLFVDGRSFVSVREEYVRRLFAVVDRDANGEISSAEMSSPEGSDEPEWEEAFAMLAMPGLTQADLNPPDTALSFSEFAAFVRQHRGGPFQPPQAATSASIPAGQARPRQSVASESVLFRRLDIDEDGRITQDELAAGPRSIQKFDFDGDGASSLEELDHLRNPFGGMADQQQATTVVPLHILSPEVSTTGLIEALFAAYGSTSTREHEGLSIAELGYRKEVLSPFDADNDGRLDRDELRYWLTHPLPHVELVVRIGEREQDLKPVTVDVPPTLEDLAVKISDAGLVSIVSGETHWELSVATDRRTTDSLQRMLSDSFGRSDHDKNGYLERSEVDGSVLFTESFSRFDRDGDGKVFEEEMASVMQGQIVAGLSRTSLATADRGKDLFQILDTNRDGRVSRRELQGAESRVDVWDVDADGQLAEQEVPQLYQLVFDRGTPQLPGFERFATASTARAKDPRDVSNGPVWFQKMDRNADGDISRREFLGTPDQFQRIDADGNELIDYLEATATIATE